MTTKFVKPGNVIEHIAAGTILSDAGVVVNGLFGVAVADATVGQKVSLALEGVYTLPKSTAVAFLVGAEGYWDTATSLVKASGAGFFLIGTVVEAAVMA